MIGFLWFSLELRSFLSLFVVQILNYVSLGFYKTIILLGLAGYEMITKKLGATHLVGYLSFHIQCALVE